jgi:archaellum component FlaC
MLENSKNTIEAAKKRYKDLVMQRSEAQALYDTALAKGGEDAARGYEELLETLDSEIKDSEEEYLNSWQETME